MFVDLQNDVTAADLALALREGYRSIEHVKRYTTTGMGTDQGKTSNVNALGIVASITGQPVAELGVTTFRPPYTPVTFGAIAGRNCGAAVRPRAAHADARLARGSGRGVRGRRPVAAALVLPARRARTWPPRSRARSRPRAPTIGILDASTLGKIDIQGRDAARAARTASTPTPGASSRSAAAATA